MGNIKHMMLKRELSLVLHFCKVGRHRKKKKKTCSQSKQQMPKYPLAWVLLLLLKELMKIVMSIFHNFLYSYKLNN